MRLLIVDDSKIERMILKEMLQSEGHAVEEAENGKEALEKVLLSPPDMIISDILMPVMDGFRLCREIRADNSICDIPVVFYTGTYTNTEDEEFAFKMGADRFLVKSMDWESFFREIQDVIKEKEMDGNVLPEFSPKDEEVYKLYNERLIEKLEDKVAELESEVNWRKKLEKQLYDSQESLQMALEGANLGMWDWNVQTGETKYNQQWAQFLGDTSEELLPHVRTWEKLLHPDDRQKTMAKLQANLDGTTEFYENEHRLKDKAGEWHWFLAKGKVVSRDESGKALRHVGTEHNITDRVEAKKTLEESHVQMEKQVEIRTADFLKANQQLEDEILLRNKIETALRESEERFRMLAENSKDVIYRMSLPDGGFEYISPAATEVFGYTPQEFYQKSILMKQVMHPDWQDYFEEKWAETLKGKVSPVYEYQIICKTGEVRWLYEKNTLIRDLHGNLMAVEGIATDITGIKQVELMLAQQNENLDKLVAKRTAELQNVSAALEKEKEKYRLIFNKAPVGIIHYDSNGIFTECNPQFAEIMGSPPEKLIGFNTLEDTKNESVLNAIKMSLAGKSGHYEGEYTSVTAGRTTHVRADYVPVFGDNHAVVGGICVAMDISDRVRVEIELKESEENARALLNATNDAVVLLDKAGIILDVNETMAGRFYKRIDEMMGACIWDFLPSRISESRKKNVHHVFKTGKPVAMIDERQGMWNYTNFYPLFNGAGDVVRVAVFAQDITDRKKAEDELKSSHDRLRNLSAYLQTAIENERKSIAREIHDDLGQMLTAIKMDAAWLKRKLPDDQALLIDKIDDTISIVDSAIQTVKRISTELRPGLLDDLGLSAAIEWQAGDYQKRSGININVTIEPEEIFLGEDLSIVIFRICQEALTNVVRHSGATDARVQLIKNSETVALVVEDNGVGINEKEIEKKNSFGLIGMRERIHAFGGRIRISRLQVGGTKVAVKIPIRTDQV